MELALGTAQFGLPYGVASGHCQVAVDEVEKIVGEALSRGVWLLDTAQAYGDSERIVGEVLHKRHASEQVRIVTKTRPRFREFEQLEDQFASDLANSLKLLKCEQIHALLVHDVDDILCTSTRARLLSCLELAKSEGKVENVGFSAYALEDIKTATAEWTPDIVQLPVNVLDQRLVKSGLLAQLKARGIEIHARSALLQGVIVSAPDMLPDHLALLAPALEQVHESGQPLELALGFLQRCTPVDAVIVGVHSARQMNEMLDVWNTAPPDCDYAALAAPEGAPLDPRQWPN